MAAIAMHVSAKLVLLLDAGDERGKRITKRVTISGIREEASTDALWAVAQAVGALLEYPVRAIELHTISAIKRCDENGEETDENFATDGLPAERLSAPNFFSCVTSERGRLLSLDFFRFAGCISNALRQVFSRQSCVFT